MIFTPLILSTIALAASAATLPRGAPAAHAHAVQRPRVPGYGASPVGPQSVVVPVAIRRKLGDMCLNMPCGHGGICRNFNDGFHCECHPGWEGRQCQFRQNPCEPDLCNFHGRCFLLGGRIDQIVQRVCHCAPGYEGGLCQLRVQDPIPIRNYPSW